MRHTLLETGDIIEKGDEIYSPSMNQWFPIDSEAYRYHPCLFPVRRLIDIPKPPEVYTVPFGTWSGCIGTVFMDGESKKVRLHNVFVGGKSLVIDFLHRKRYDEKHFVLEDEDVIEAGDLFTSAYGLSKCEGSLGMTVYRAKLRYSSLDLIVRPITVL